MVSSCGVFTIVNGMVKWFLSLVNGTVNSVGGGFFISGVVQFASKPPWYSSHRWCKPPLTMAAMRVNVGNHMIV